MANWNPAANEIFLHALEIDDPEQRRDYLESACGENAGLRQAVDALLLAHAQSGSFLEQSAPTAAPKGEKSMADSTPEKSGTIIAGRFKLLQQIGEGGMGTVWMAEQFEPVRRQVALKVIKPGMDSGQVLARFEAERQALALMDHPNIAKVLDAGTSESGRPYFVMELVKGIVITKYCAEKMLTLRQRLELMIPVCQAIQHAHQKGVIHRDIKPSNVLIALYDGKPVPKVIDFGVAKAMGQQLTDRTLFTNYGSIVGTLEYMSPEQAELNQLDIDTRSDIYSLGVLLYELLTGSTPLDRKKLHSGALLEVLRLIREVEPPKPSTRLSTSDTLATLSKERQTEPSQLTKLVRGEVDWIVMKALEKDRNRRYETANNFADDIRRYLADEPVHASPPSTSYQIRKFVKRNRIAVLGSLVMLLILIAGMIGTTWGFLAAVGAKSEAVLNAMKANNEAFEAQKARERAVLAETDARDQERHAKAEADEAKKARDEAQRLALAEKAARDKAVENEKRAEVGEEEIRKRLVENQQTLVSAQIARAAGLWQSDPGQAKTLLRDFKACPPQSRDFTWHFFHHLCERERTAFVSTDADHHCATFSPDGKTLAAGGTQGTTHIWEFASGKLLQKFFRDKGHVRAVQFSKDGKSLMTFEANDETNHAWIVRWDIASGNLISSKEITVNAHRAVISPDSKWIVTCFYEKKEKPNNMSQRLHKGEAVLWNTETGESKDLVRNHAAGILNIAFSQDSKMVAATSSHTTKVFLWHTETGAEYASFGAPGGWIDSIAFSHDGKYLAFGNAGYRLNFWNIVKKQEQTVFTGHNSDIHGVAFSPNDRFLVSCTSHDIRVWEINNRWGNDASREVMLLQGYSTSPMLFTPDGRGLILEKSNSDLVHVELPVQTEYRTIRSHGDGINALAFSPDDTLLASVSRDRSARLTNTKTGQSVVMDSFPDQPSSVAFSPDGQTVFVGATLELADKKIVGQIFRWDVKAGKLDPWLGHEKKVMALAVSPAHQLLASASDDVVKLWDLQAGKEIGQLEVGQAVPLKGIRILAWHPTAKILAVGQPQGASLYPITFWNLNERPFKTTKTVWPYGVTRMQFTSNGEYLMLMINNPSLNFIEVKTGNIDRNRRIALGDATIASLALTPDEKTVALGLTNHTVQLWDLPSKQLRATLTGHTYDVAALAFSSDGLMLASADKHRNDDIFWVRGGTIKLWNARPDRPIGHEHIPLLQFTQDGSRLHSKSTSMQMIWDPVRGKDLATLPHTSNIGCVSTLTPDGQRIIEIADFCKLRLLDAKTQKEIARHQMPDKTLLGIPQFCENNQVAIIDYGTALHFFDLDTLKLLKTYSYPFDAIITSPNGRILALQETIKGTNYSVNKIKCKMIVRDLDTEREIMMPVDSEQPLMFVGNDHLLATEFPSLILKLLDLKTGKPNPILGKQKKGPVAVSADGQTLATASPSDDGKTWQIRIWNIAEGKEWCQPVSIKKTLQLALALTSDHHLVMATEDGTAVKFWPRVKYR